MYCVAVSLLTWLRSVFGGSGRKVQLQCLACDSTELVFVAEDAYRCSSCGHEGGDGLPAYLAARKRSQIEALSPEQRFTLACKHLEAAGNLLSGIRGLGEGSVIDASAIAASVVKATIGIGVGVHIRNEVQEEEERAMAAAYRDLLESEQLLDQAAMALSEQLQIPLAERLTHKPMHLHRGTLLTSAQVLQVELDRLKQIARR